MHLLFSYGVTNTYLVVVVDELSATVFGHHVLDLNTLYGLTGNEG